MPEDPSQADPGAADPDFASEFRAVVAALRAALARAVRLASIDADRPPDLARRLELDKNLAWKLSRLLGEDDPVAVLRFIPGPNGLQILVDRLSVALDGAEQARLALAALGFERLQERHAGDRNTLELLALGIARPQPVRELVEPIRRQAFLGNSAIWGYQARTLVALAGVQPDPTDTRSVRVVRIGALLGFRRLRPDIRAQVLSQPQREAPGKPLSMNGAEADSPLLLDLCSSPQIPVERIETNGELRYELGPGPVGETQRLDLAYGLCFDGYLPRHRDSERESNTLAVDLLAPIETLEFVTLVHRELQWGVDPIPHLHGRMTTNPREDGRAPGSVLLPVERQVESSQTPRADLTRLHGLRLGQLYDRLIGTLDGDDNDYDAWRLELAYPPIPAEVHLRFELPAR